MSGPADDLPPAGPAPPAGPEASAPAGAPAGPEASAASGAGAAPPGSPAAEAPPRSALPTLRSGLPVVGGLLVSGLVTGLVLRVLGVEVLPAIALGLLRAERLLGTGLLVGVLVVGALVLPAARRALSAGAEPSPAVGADRLAAAAVAGGVLTAGGAAAAAGLLLTGGAPALAAVPDAAHRTAEVVSGGLLLAALGAVAVLGRAPAEGGPGRAWVVLAVLLVAGPPLVRAAVGAVPPLVAALDVVHVAAMGAWVGGLAALTIAGRPALRVLPPGPRRTAVLAAGLRAFAPVALVAVLTLTAAGTALAVLRLEDLRELVTTGYGRAVLLKATLLVALVGLAAWQRERLAPELDRLAAAGDGGDPAAGDAGPDAAAERVVGRALAAELALMVAALLVAGVLGGLAAPAG